MSRFTRYSRISALELYEELERRAWCAAALALLLCLSLVGAALCLPLPRLAAWRGDVAANPQPARARMPRQSPRKRAAGLSRPARRYGAAVASVVRTRVDFVLQ